MRNRLLMIMLLAIFALAATYVVSPLLAAVKLRHAIATGDRATVARMIEWDSFRESLRRTIARNAELLPAATEAGRAVRPTMWQRVRSLFGHSMLDRFIETYITPDGLTKLYKANERRHATPGEPTLVQAGVSLAQVRQHWRRVKRAEFLSPFAFALELEDRHVPDRRIKSLFSLSHVSLTGFEWKLSEVELGSFQNKERRQGKPDGV